MKKTWGILLIIGVFYSCSRPGSKNQVTFVSWGGSYQQAQDSAYLHSFQQDSGITVKQVSYSGELPKIEGMVNAGKVDWDVVSVTQEMFSQGERSGLFENLDYKVIDTANFIRGSVYPKGIAHLIFSTVVAYNTGFYQTHKRPQNWKEFWDVTNFPGARSLNDGPVGNLEFALLADGIPPDKLYPLDVDRAFKKLSAIKPFIKVWWKEGQQPIQLLSSGEVQLATAYNGRIAKAKSDGEPIAINWTGGMLEPEYFVVPKGAVNHDPAMRLIAYATSAKQQKKFVQLIPYGPTNLDVFKLLPDSVMVNLPDSKANLAGQFLINGEWWSKNYDKLQVKWNAWKLKN